MATVRSEPQHSPLPWRIVRWSRHNIEIDANDGHGAIARVVRDAKERNANAAYIVTCVNSHAQLVEALRTALEYICNDEDCANDHDDMCKMIREALNHAAKGA